MRSGSPKANAKTWQKFRIFPGKCNPDKLEFASTGFF